ncbi:hypothetical protein Acsp05_44550 [Actinokineospora sp. NBRC 105648]|nr:hypothetical protein Acsp05_44550 [Actinokineospora sp. NBRC 105648]
MGAEPGAVVWWGQETEEQEAGAKGRGGEWAVVNRGRWVFHWVVRGVSVG